MNTIRFRTLLTTVGATCVVGFSVASCAPASDVSAENAKTQKEESAMGDAGITASIKTRLLGDRAFESLNISVTTVDGVVTLQGVAPDSSARETAERIARKVNGVVSVNNELTTKTNQGIAEKTTDVMSDSWITTKVKSALLADDVSKGFDVSVKTLEGVVLLEGQLNSQSDINHVIAIAEGLDGVKSVDTTSLTISDKS